MDYAALEEELPRFVGELLGVPCEWGDEPRTFRTTTQATIDVVAFAALGVDDLIPEVIPDDVDPINNPPQGIEVHQIGQREFTIQVRVWSKSQRLAKSARRVLDRMRTRLRLPTVQEDLRAMGIGFVATEGLIDLDTEVGGRKYSETTMDVRFATHSEEVDKTISYIASVQIQSGTTGGDGITQPSGDPSPIQIDQTITEPSP